jgi:hypothetical protein
VVVVMSVGMVTDRRSSVTEVKGSPSGPAGGRRVAVSLPREPSCGSVPRCPPCSQLSGFRDRAG